MLCLIANLAPFFDKGKVTNTIVLIGHYKPNSQMKHTNTYSLHKQILQVVLFNGMEKTSHWAALYFVLLMTFGNYVLFNLLVAILVEGFSQEVSIIYILAFNLASYLLSNRLNYDDKLDNLAGSLTLVLAQ